jgi:hypothetical protein
VFCRENVMKFAIVPAQRGGGDRGRSNHQIKVLRVSLQTDVTAKRVTATNEKFDPIFPLFRIPGPFTRSVRR